MISSLHRSFLLGMTILGLAVAIGAGFLFARESVDVAPGRPSVPGQTATALPDGRSFGIGGVGSEVAGAHLDPCAWHTATMLPDGRILVIGGVGADGIAKSGGQLVDPTTLEVEPVALGALQARSHHTATLLTDGSVLIVGGSSRAGRALNDAALWNPLLGTLQILDRGLRTARRDHTATLLADGRVLVWGGTDSFGHPILDGETFDPASGRFQVDPLSPRQRPAVRPVIFSGSLPERGAVDVATNAVVALRFSDRLRPQSANAESVTLSGPEGVRVAKVVPAEDGRLVFVTAAAPLAPNAVYRVNASGLIDVDGGSVPASAFDFTTSAAPVEDEESWIPGAEGSADWQSRRPRSPLQDLPPLRARDGETALAGQVLTLDGRGLSNVTLEIDGVAARSDGTGRFLLTRITAGRKVLEMDGASANTPSRTYGFFEAGVAIEDGITNVLPYTIWMPKIDTTHAVSIPFPTTSEVVMTTPLIPGLEAHIPPGTSLVDDDGRPVTSVSITPIPIDRTPFPLPGAYVPIYFTIQPGGAYVRSAGGYSRGVRLIYPNYRHEPVGSRLNFWHYDPDERGWYVYGKGTVTPSGAQVAPDPNVAVYEFTGAMISGGGSPPPTAPVPGGLRGGEPVDLSSGLFVSEQTDLVVNDVIPIVIRRVYRPGDPTSRDFGIGTNHPLGTFLYSAANYQEADLVLPDGARIHYVRISPGNGTSGAVYEHTTTPGQFYKSRITWNGTGWDVALKDGTVFVFGEMAPLQSIRDRYGNVLTIKRSNGAQGNIARVTTPHGRYVDFTYDGQNRITQVKDNVGRTVSYTYDGSGCLSTVNTAEGGTCSITYDTSNRILTMKDARQKTFVTNQYDANGRVYRQTLANGGVYQFAYTLDANGNVTRTDVTDPRNMVRRVTFTPVPSGAVFGGYALTDTYAFGQPEARTFTYERQAGTNLVLSITDPLGRKTAFTHDTEGNVTSVTRLADTAGAVTSHMTWDTAINKPTSITDPLDHGKTFAYDASGRLASITNSEQEQLTLAYGTDSQPISVTFPGSHTFQFAYDAGDQVGLTDPLGKTSSRFVDGAGRTGRVADAEGRWREFEYSPLNEITKISDPLGGSSNFVYDHNGNLLTRSDPLSKVTTFTYDDMNFPLTRKDALNRTESFVFDKLGHLTKHTDRRGKVTNFTYDVLGRRTFAGFGATKSGNNTVYESTVTYSYDPANRVRTVVDSLAGTQTLDYDDLDRLTSESGPRGTVTYTYDAAGRRATMTVAGQPTLTYAYDDANRLTQVTQGTSIAVITYDSSGRRETLTLPDGIVVVYGYDGASRLSDLTYFLGANVLGNRVYEYDASGRQRRVSGSFARTNLPAAMTSATYDAMNEMTKRVTTNMSYDANGNMTNDGTNTYTWDARNQLASTSGGVTASFKYDGLGRRNERVVAGVTTRYLFDGFNPVQELSTTTPTANLLGGLQPDERFLRTDAAGARSFLTDLLGNTVALADSAGALQTQYTYEPFGKSSFAGPSSSSSYQFTGRDNDGTGLFYYRARYYSPLLQRFVSEDPLRYSGPDMNLYEYVANDPLNGTDPFGLWTFQLGYSFKYTFYGLSGTIFGGIVIDGNGNVGGYNGEGGGGGVGGGLSGGAQGMWSGNADIICDMSGPFLNVGGGIGEAVAGEAGGFVGYGSHGQPVGGVEGGIGFGGGMSGSGMTTNTHVTPWFNVNDLTRNLFNGSGGRP